MSVFFLVTASEWIKFYSTVGSIFNIIYYAGDIPCLVIEMFSLCKHRLYIAVVALVGTNID